MKIIDVEKWNRKEHFEFFSKRDNPFFGIVTEMDVSKAYNFAKKNQVSFFAYYMYQSLRAVNRVEAFKYRIQDGKVVCFDTIHAGSTLLRTDTTFAFSFIPFSENFEIFNQNLHQEIQEVEQSTGLRASSKTNRADQIYYSAIPWIKFTGLTHAKDMGNADSVPKISFGKLYEKDQKKMLPMSVDVHHGLMDAFHVGQYVEEFQKLLFE